MLSFRSRVWIYILIIILISGFILWNKRPDLEERFVQYMDERLRQEFGLTIQIEGFSGDILGHAKLYDVSVSTLSEEGRVPVFKAEEIIFKYRWIDFLLENFSGWFDIELKKPTFYANVPFVLSRLPAQAGANTDFGLFAGTAKRVGKNARLHIDQGVIAWKDQDDVFSYIDGVIETNAFDLRIGLNHVKLGLLDVSSELKFWGRVNYEDDGKFKEIVGLLSSKNTIVNWKPTPQESRIEFRLTQDKLIIEDTVLMGGLSVAGYVSHTTSEDMDIKIRAEKYPLHEMRDIFSYSGRDSMGGMINVDWHITGSFRQPLLRGTLDIYSIDDPSSKFSNIQMNLQGILPDVTLTQARLMNPSGMVMNFAGQQVHVLELFDSGTYARLIANKEQTEVAWGEWSMQRSKDEDSVIVQRDLSPRVKLSYEQYSEYESALKPQEQSDEVGVEYSLTSQDSFKMEVKEDEKIVGWQRKTEF